MISEFKSAKSGVYQIKQLSTGKCYVGSSVNMEIRLKQHLRALNRQKHCNKKLQRSWNKYGSEDFVFEKIVSGPVNKLLPLEQKFIDSLNPFFNINPKAGNSFGRKFSKKTKIKMSKIAKAQGRGGHNKGSSKHQQKPGHKFCFKCKELKELSLMLKNKYLCKPCGIKNTKSKAVPGLRWEKMKNFGKKITCYNETFGCSYFSVKAAARSVSGSECGIYYAIKNGTKYKNLFWRENA